MSGVNVMNMLQMTHLDLLYFSFRLFPLNSFHYQYNVYYHFYGLLVCPIFEIFSYTHVLFDEKHTIGIGKKWVHEYKKRFQK
jgi:hypothetical protein